MYREGRDHTEGRGALAREYDVLASRIILSTVDVCEWYFRAFSVLRVVFSGVSLRCPRSEQVVQRWGRVPGMRGLMKQRGSWDEDMKAQKLSPLRSDRSHEWP